MKVKNLVVVDDNGQEHTFTHRSLVEDKGYNPNNDPEVQGIGLADLQEPEAVVEPKKTKKKK